jgi:hypothetical protein
MMEKITLEPGVWTRLNARSFQARPAAEIKIAAVKAANPQSIVTPAVDTDLYFTNIGMGEYWINLDPLFDDYFTAVFMMPVGASAATIVVN